MIGGNRLQPFQRASADVARGDHQAKIVEHADRIDGIGENPQAQLRLIEKVEDAHEGDGDDLPERARQ